MRRFSCFRIVHTPNIYLLLPGVLRTTLVKTVFLFKVLCNRTRLLRSWVALLFSMEVERYIEHKNQRHRQLCSARSALHACCSTNVIFSSSVLFLFSVPFVKYIQKCDPNAKSWSSVFFFLSFSPAALFCFAVQDFFFFSPITKEEFT